MPQAVPLIAQLDQDVGDDEMAAESGNKAEMIATVEKTAKDSRAGAHYVQSNPNLYNLAKNEGPDGLDNLANGFKDGTKNADDENNLMGHFADSIEKYSKH